MHEWIVVIVMYSVWPSTGEIQKQVFTQRTDGKARCEALADIWKGYESDRSDVGRYDKYDARCQQGNKEIPQPIAKGKMT